MSKASPSPTFRDPAGSLHFEEHRVVRTIHESGYTSLLEFIRTPLCIRMQQRGDLITATVDQHGDVIRLFHPRLPVITYPWEWTPSQWVLAGELTLALCDEALEEGWILKDATPLNVLFVGSKPIFVDILSFERLDPTSSTWLAYAQYVRTFLLPLVMQKVLNWPITLTFFKRDGYEPIELYAALGWWKRLSRDVFWPITLPTLLERRKSWKESAKNTSATKKDPGLAVHILKRTLSGLRQRTRRAIPTHAASEWSQYQQTSTHYTSEQSAKKYEWVQEVLKELQADFVLDIGANTGEFSILAAETGQVIALERDAASAERLFRLSHSRSLKIHTIHADIARPTPAAGWDNTESTALLDRLEKVCDLVMMLAIIHHLILIEQIPICSIIALCHRLTRRHLIIEWVPVEDPMYQSLMRNRESLYGALTTSDLLRACMGHFRIVRQHVLGNGRILFLFEKLEC